MIKANIGLIAATVKTNVNFLVLVRDYRVYGFRILLALMIVIIIKRIFIYFVNKYRFVFPADVFFISNCN
jgi:hypothetical protein